MTTVCAECGTLPGLHVNGRCPLTHKTLHARDPRTGRFVDQRAHAYRLKFDLGPDEVVYAVTPSDAVRRRVNVRLPSTITDLSVMASFAGRKAYGGLGPRVVATREPAPSTWSERMALARKRAQR